MTDLLIHPKNSAQIDGITLRPPQALLIHGKQGSGKETLAHTIASSITGSDISANPYVRIINPDDKSISIDEVRGLQQFLKLKVPATEELNVNRLVLVINAERLNHEAQNALLKTLEEPPVGTMIILTTSDADKMLATIKSRTSMLGVLPVTEAQATEHYRSSGVSSAVVTKNYALSQGQVGLLNSLINQESHPLLDSVNLAKQILAEKPGQRLLRTADITKDKSEVKNLLDALLRITHAGLFAASRAGSVKNISSWSAKQAEVVRAIELFGKNAQPKLVMDNLFLSI